MSTEIFKNLLLQRLEPEVIDRLHLQRLELPVDREIECPGKRIGHVFFLETGIASMTAAFQDGFNVEIALVGSEGALGTSSMFGTRRSLHRVSMQIAGYGYSSEIETATREFRRCGQFHDVILQAVHAQYVQSAQTAGCNARHQIEQRLARWLLLCFDRIGDQPLTLSHEYLADMLGVTRSSVTVVAGQLQEKKLIQYSRGKIKLLDLPGLEGLSCECYGVVRDHLASLAENDQMFGT